MKRYWLSMLKSMLLLALVSFASQKMFAQGSSYFQLWTDFNVKYSINDHWQVAADVGYRTQPSNSIDVVFLRPRVNYVFNKIFKASIGLANFNTWAGGDYNRIELRTFEYAHISWPRIGNFQFQHRLGLDQRWFYFSDLELQKFVHRFRYQLGIKSPSFSLFDSGFLFYITANTEFLRDVSDSELQALIDHNRYMIGIGNTFGDHWHSEIQYQMINAVDDLVGSLVREINILRIRVYYQF